MNGPLRKQVLSTPVSFYKTSDGVLPYFAHSVDSCRVVGINNFLHLVFPCMAHVCGAVLIECMFESSALLLSWSGVGPDHFLALSEIGLSFLGACSTNTETLFAPHQHQHQLNLRLASHSTITRGRKP